MLKWLNQAHIKLWWDRDVIFIEESVKEKYASYVFGYKIANGEKSDDI